jgi:tRNA (guanine37-N1)-methyltransferase
MLIEIITIFPELFPQTFEVGMVGQARRKGLTKVDTIDLRVFAEDRRGTVDDRPYGGGEGMVLKPEPIFRAVERCRGRSGLPAHVVLLTPQGKRFDQVTAKKLSLKEHLILICGRYEGVDQRVVEHLADEEISVGDFVLSGGEFAALLIVDAVCRLIPGVVGKGSAVLEESFMDGLLDYPQYTRPVKFRRWRVPEILLGGDHEKIRNWREQQALEYTRERRPDLMVTAKEEEPGRRRTNPRGRNRVRVKKHD